MSESLLARLRGALGAARLDHDPAGRPRVAPESAEALAAALGLAHAEGWRVRVEGRGTWAPPDAPADLVITTRGLDRVVRVAESDLVATVQTGVTTRRLAHRLGEAGMWLPWDPPGDPERSVGSVIATGTAGPLRHGAGAIRDHVLGCTVVTGDGRIVRPGGAVVKNVAGYDLTRLQVGGFGAFGVLAEVHLRLRVLPAADLTCLTEGPRDGLTRAARDLMEAAAELAALELLSPGATGRPEWVLGARLTGPAEGVSAEAERLGEVTGSAWTRLAPTDGPAFWRSAAVRTGSGEVALRLGVLPDGLDDVLDLLAERLDLRVVSAGAGTGSLRWTGHATPDRLTALRGALAPREVPLTVERAPWPILRAVGHFGAYREGVGPLVGRLREVFDPGRVLRVSIEASADD